jgi:parallel beta-helix repeat protein
MVRVGLVELYDLPAGTQQKTIYVDDDFVDDPPNHKWDTIQEGVDDAEDGDTVLVYSGTYNENVKVTKSLTIKSTSGDPKDRIVQAKNPDDPVFEVTADDVTISGFTVDGGLGSNGIYLNSVKNCEISNNNCSGHWAIALGDSSNNAIIGNNCSNNDVGISLWNSNNNALTGNNVTGNYIGIEIGSSSGNILTENTLLKNNWNGVYLQGTSSNNELYHNNFINNSASDMGTLNQWDNGYPSGGNYWSDYKEKYKDEYSKDPEDVKCGPNQDQLCGGDGIWDKPYKWISGNADAEDKYPMVDREPPELPDLTLSLEDISFSNLYPAEGESITINATIHNIGGTAANNVTLQFFDGDPDSGTQIGTNQIIYLITAGGNETVNVTWVAEIGIHDIYVAIDRYGNITESNESNNKAYRSILIGECTKDIIAQKILLKQLNYGWNYDFYEEYHNYDDNATGPDPVKDPDGCTIPLDDSDIWIVHFSLTSPGFYPSLAAIMGPVIGVDTNTWYNWSTPVKNVYGKQEITYPELKVRSVEKWVSMVPWIGEDLEELLGGLLNASEFSIKLDGVYAQAPMRWDNRTNQSSIPIKFSGKAIGPTGIGEGGNCEMNFEKFYDMDDPAFFGDTLNNIACRANIGLPNKSIGYTKSVNGSLEFIEFDGTGMLDLLLSPSGDAGVRIRVDDPIAVAQAGMCELNAELSARAVGDISTRVPLPLDFLNGNWNVNCSLPTPTLENPVTFIGETVLAIQNFSGDEYIESVYTNFSGYYYRFEDLHQLIPEFIITIYPIVINYSLCFNLTEINPDIPCGHIDIPPFGPIDIYPCELCLFNGTLLSIDEWWYHVSLYDLIFDSPVDVHIYDSMGRHIGQNATNGIALEIPYSTYIVNGSKKRLTFPTTTDKFMLVLNGTDAGTYNMTVYRSILISGVNNTNIIKGITYRVDNMPTNTGTIDYYNINFDEIEKQVNEKVHTGMNITDAINESFDLIISDKNVTKFPTALFASDAFGADGDQVVLHARLMSLDNSLGNKAITFKIDDNVVGQTITDVYGNVTLNYTILNDMDIGIHQISTIYSGDSSYTNTEGYASLNVLNKPPEVQLDLPSPIVRGTSLINGTIIDAKLEQIMLKIDNVIVADSIPYLWESTKYADGLHLIQLTAIDSFGEKGQSNAFVIVDNTVPTITITSPVNGTTYPTISVNLNYTISEPTVWVGYSLDGAENVTLYGNTILTGLGEGIHTVTVYANDTPGNMGSASIYFITLSGGKTIYVDDDFADDPPNHKWDTIQEGIIDANEGDTINVRDGTYTENIDVTKSHLTIKSENGFANCFVQAANPNDHIFEITADNVNINGFTLKNATGSWKAGIYLASDHNTISNNSALNNYNGIYLSSSNNNQLTDNIANTNNNCGILLRNESNSNILTNNTANFNTNFGIFLYPASHNILTNNTANSNEWNGMHLDYSNNNLLISNIANSNRKDGISVNYPSSNNTLINNTANTNNRDGFHLWSSSSNKLMSNIANSNHKYGISLSSTANNNISCNWVVQNQQGGFHITDGCTGNIIKDNNIMANGGIAGDSWHYNFYNDQSDDVIVENNYWGTDSIAIIAESIYDKSDDPSKGMVDFEPSLTEPAPCAPGSGPKLCTSPDPPSHDFGTVPKNKEPSWSFELWNCESDTLTWTVNVDQPGITVYPTSGSTTTEIDTVTVTLGGVYYLGLSPGTYTGHITVKSNGGSKIGTITVKVPNPYPIASFTYIPPGPDVNKGVIFDASLSNDPGGFITNYEWNFGDGSYGTGKVVTHSYSSAGTYKVTLRVTDNDGTVNSTSKSVSVAGGLQQFTFLSTDNAVPITIDGTLQSSPYTASWTSGSVHSVNALSEFIAQPDCLKYVFTGWTGAITLSYTLLPPTFSPGTYTANYKKQYYLTVDTEPQGIATISGAGWYDEGAMATTGNAPKEVTVGDENYLFETWKVDGSPVSLPFDWIPLKMDNCHTVTASYQQIDGLVAEWHFDEGSGSTVKDNTGNGNDGIIHGATWINGIKGKALKFDGKDDYVEVQDSSSLRITGNIKVEAWVKVEELGSKYHFIVSKHYTPAGYTLFINPANKFAFEINGQPVASTTTPELGKWYHVVGTYDQSQLKIYVNDVLENTKSCTAKLATNNQKLRIGQWSAGGYCFKGIIDEVNIYANA